jgi:uncharacterized protein (DUF58 family)
MDTLREITGCLFNSDARDVEEVQSGPFRWIWRFYTWRLTHAGRWLVWPTVALVAYTSASRDYQAYVPLAYLLALWLVALAAMLLFSPRARISVNQTERVTAGAWLQVDIEIEPLSRWSSDLYLVPHRLPGAVESVPPDGVPLPPALPGRKARVRLALHCPRRGVYPLRGYRLESDFPFGVLRSFRHFAHDSRLVVCPQYTPLARLELPTGRRYQPGGVALASETGDSVEFVGSREFREGDNIRDIDWRATGRLDRLIVREYRQEYFLCVAVILDTHVPRARGLLSGPLTLPSPRGGEGRVRGARARRRQSFEHAVSLTAAISEYLARREYVVEIFAAGSTLYHLTAGRSLAYLEQILDILACVDENPHEPFAAIEPELIGGLSQISTVICVFLDWNDTRRAFVRNVKEQGAGVKAIVISDEPAGTDHGGVRRLTNADLAHGVDEL